MVKMLCEMKHVNVNLPDTEGNTPLMIACQAGRLIQITKYTCACDGRHFISSLFLSSSKVTPASYRFYSTNLKMK